MTYFKKYSVVVFCLFFVAAQCLGSEQKSIFRLIGSAGINWGSIVKGEKIDAVSSATQIGANAGVHTEINIFGHFAETGLDYHFYQENLVYKDASKNIDGTRTFNMHSTTIPLMYTWHFFNRDNGNPFLTFGLGLFGSYFPVQSIQEKGSLGSYQLNNFVAGSMSRIAFYPLELQDGTMLGLYINLLRSFPGNFYMDDYYKDKNIGNLASFNFGMVLNYKL